MVDNKGISIWFFIGILLFIYGVIILVANIFEALYNTFGRKVVLSNLHFGIWWGILLVILGLLYSIGFRPGKKKQQ